MISHQVLSGTTNAIKQNLEFYNSIKPRIERNSYTVIATLNDAKTSELLALATGTQAGIKQYDNDIEDCHAESLLHRAYKRYLLDKIDQAMCVNGNSNTRYALDQIIKQINQQELALFVSQFPCGFVTRFKGSSPVDEETGNIITKKPGRGQLIDGETIYVRREACFDKLGRWISDGFQGKSLGQKFGTKVKVTRLIVGDCEPDPLFNYDSQLDILKQRLKSQEPLEIELVHMRQDEFTYDSSNKQPLPVATVWWASKLPKRVPEYVVDGRRLGITRKQCIKNSDRLKLRSSDFWLHEDLKRICELHA